MLVFLWGILMNFYTVVLRQSLNFWVALCLENGLVGQGKTQEDSINHLKEAINSFQEVYEVEKDIYSAPISIEMLHEFLTVEGVKPTSTIFELRAIHA